MREPNLDEAMDACRSNSDDLQLPELYQLAERVNNDANVRSALEQRQQLDRRIAAALRKVDLSTSCRVRLLAAANSVADAHSTVSLHLSKRQYVPDRRRRWMTMAAAGLVVASLLLLLALSWNWLNPWRMVGPQYLARSAMQEWRVDPRRWQSMGKLTAGQRSAVSRFLRNRPARWQVVSTPLDSEALVFDLPGDRTPARLYVLQAGRRVTQLPTRPPQQPQTSYEGRLFAAWQETTRVYLLAVAGSPARYRDVVRTPGPSLAKTTDGGVSVP